MTKQCKCILCWLAVAGWMAVIFWMSAQTGNQSAKTRTDKFRVIERQFCYYLCRNDLRHQHQQYRGRDDRINRLCTESSSYNSGSDNQKDHIDHKICQTHRHFGRIIQNGCKTGNSATHKIMRQQEYGPSQCIGQHTYSQKDILLYGLPNRCLQNSVFHYSLFFLAIFLRLTPVFISSKPSPYTLFAEETETKASLSIFFISLMTSVIWFFLRMIRSTRLSF